MGNQSPVIFVKHQQRDCPARIEGRVTGKYFFSIQLKATLKGNSPSRATTWRGRNMPHPWSGRSLAWVTIRANPDRAIICKAGRCPHWTLCLQSRTASSKANSPLKRREDSFIKSTMLYLTSSIDYI
jgi:hypothetical protein